MKYLWCMIFGHKSSISNDKTCYHIEYCPRCLKITKIEKVRMSVKELLEEMNPWNQHGNQVW